MKGYSLVKKSIERAGIDVMSPDFDAQALIKQCPELKGMDVKDVRAACHLIAKTRGRHMVFHDNDSERMEMALKMLGYEVTTCELSKARLIRKRGGEWKYIDNGIMVDLMDEMMRGVLKIGVSGKPSPLEFAKQKREDVLLALCRKNKPHNATMAFISACGEWDGNERLDNVMERMFMVGGVCDDYPDVNGELLVRASRWLFVGVIHRALNPGCGGCDEIPVFIGAQGIGKDLFLESLLPETLGVKRSVSISEWRGFDVKKKLAERMIGKHIAKLAEMSDIRNADVAFVKDFISETSDTIRRSYRPDAEDVPRLPLFVGTTNRSRPLPKDATGNRRFVPVFLGGKAQPVGTAAYKHIMKELDVKKLWAEAMCLYNSQADKMALFRMMETEKIRDSVMEIQSEISIRNETYDGIVDQLIDGYSERLTVGLRMIDLKEIVEDREMGMLGKGQMDEWKLREAMEGRLKYGRFYRNGKRWRGYRLIGDDRHTDNGATARVRDIDADILDGEDRFDRIARLSDKEAH